MSELPGIGHAVWMLTGVVSALLVLIVIRSGNYRPYPYFAAYLLLNFGQTIAFVLLYRSRGFQAAAVFRVAWITQALVVAVRALAVGHIFQRVLGAYRGIWRLAVRLLTACAATVLVSALAVAHWNLRVAVIVVDRGVELSIAGVLVAFFVFSRYYKVPVQRADRALALGFCLYSCFAVLNNTVLEVLSDRFSTLWSLLDTLAYLASLLTWLQALRVPVTQRTEKPALIAAAIYNEFSPEINLRLRRLNNQLLSIWKAEVPHL